MVVKGIGTLAHRQQVLRHCLEKECVVLDIEDYEQEHGYDYAQHSRVVARKFGSRIGRHAERIGGHAAIQAFGVNRRGRIDIVALGVKRA